ncbi:uncharacterized protein BYT42DRAFT_570311 [Radiomyces spectabilis]|uniref:uncharacterized protein n=1 Tax=Radiomyces spectabilis TaxID=64574 RepID=UPI00221FCA28|nr:uncharacterized protein BYT42DRAFT_570311 [Radiomyces spectabilis]KAI8377427.1 hypothetical protein BYT42DRAFT_570311 [Radiomyces spectabilis]
MEFTHAVDRFHSALKDIFLKKAKTNSQKQALQRATNIPWSWVAVCLAQLLIEYPTAITETIILGELELQWERAFLKRYRGLDSNFGTIQALYDSSPIRAAALEVTVKEWSIVPETNIWLVTVGEATSYQVLDIYLHPKFNQWVTPSSSSPSQPSNQTSSPFLKDRSIRMICSSLVNTPIKTQYHNSSLSRINRIGRAPPTQLLMFMLTSEDGPFIRQEFLRPGNRLENVVHPTGLRSRKVHRLWLKVIHVECITHTSPIASIQTASQTNGMTKLQRTDIYVVDHMGSDEPALFSLYDEQAQLATLIRRGDYIGLYNPKVSDRCTQSQEARSDIVLEYDNETVIFLMSDKDARVVDGVNRDSQRPASLVSNGSNSPISEFWNHPSQKKGIVESDDEGFMDCINYMDRIFIRDLDSCMLNVTIFGRVVAMASNNPFTTNDGLTKMDRYAIRIVDVTGKMDVTLWEEAGRRTRQLRPGHYVLMTGLSTSAVHMGPKDKPIWYVNGSIVCGTQVFNVSTMNSLLVSSSLRHVTPLEWLDKQDHTHTEAIVAGWELRTCESPDLALLSDDYTDRQGFCCHQPIGNLGALVIADSHAACLRPVTTPTGPQGANHKKGIRMCDFCGHSIANDEVVQTFRSRPDSISGTGWIEWRLDDGTRSILAYGGEEVSQERKQGI